MNSVHLTLTSNNGLQLTKRDYSAMERHAPTLQKVAAVVGVLLLGLGAAGLYLGNLPPAACWAVGGLGGAGLLGAFSWAMGTSIRKSMVERAVIHRASEALYLKKEDVQSLISEYPNIQEFHMCNEILVSSQALGDDFSLARSTNAVMNIFRRIKD